MLTKPIAVTAAALAVTLTSGVAVAATGERDLRRLAGASRFDTAVAISQEAFPDGASAVYLARADAFADALAGSSLTDRGPILLVPQCGPVPASVKTEVDRLEPIEVVALGGPGAICDGVLDQFAGAISSDPSPQQTITVSGQGDENSDPFLLEGGNYTISYNFSGSCEYGAFVEPTNNNNIIGFDVARGTGPIQGDTNQFDVAPTEYFVDMIASTTQGCPWTITFTSR